MLSGAAQAMDFSPTPHHWGPPLGRQWHGIQMFPQRVVCTATKKQEVAKSEFPFLQSPEVDDDGHSLPQRPSTDDTVQTYRYVYLRF